MRFLIVLMIFIIFILIVFYIVKIKIEKLSLKLFGSKDIIGSFKKQELESENTPKSLFGMESLALPYLKKDFPNLNIDELKAIGENNILNVFKSIENKKVSDIFLNTNVSMFIESKINDLKENENYYYDNIKIHKTILNNYSKTDAIATITFQTSLEYLFKKNNENYKKIQDRISTEFIYIIDKSKVDLNVKALGLNCPNCGALVNSLDGTCSYCGSTYMDLVDRTWVFNNIKQI